MIDPKDYGAKEVYPPDQVSNWEGAVFPNQDKAIDFFLDARRQIELVDSPILANKGWTVLWRT